MDTEITFGELLGSDPSAVEYHQPLRQRQLDSAVDITHHLERSNELFGLDAGNVRTVICHSPFGFLVGGPSASAEPDLTASRLASLCQQNFANLRNALLIGRHQNR